MTQRERELKELNDFISHEFQEAGRINVELQAAERKVATGDLTAVIPEGVVEIGES